MASVTKNPDGTYLVTVTEKEERAIRRMASEPVTMPPKKKIENILTTTINDWYRDFLAADAPLRLSKFDALPIAGQDRVDLILNGGVDVVATEAEGEAQVE